MASPASFWRALKMKMSVDCPSVDLFKFAGRERPGLSGTPLSAILAVAIAKTIERFDPVEAGVHALKFLPYALNVSIDGAI